MKTLLILCLICLVSLPMFAAISVTTDGANRTVTMAYTSTIDKVNATLEASAEYLYDTYGFGLILDANDAKVPFASLTNQQKLHVVDVAVKWQIREWARIKLANDAVQTTIDDLPTTVDPVILDE